MLDNIIVVLNITTIFFSSFLRYTVLSNLYLIILNYIVSSIEESASSSPFLRIYLGES